MRSFFFLLLVTNIAFFGWQMSQERDEPDQKAMVLSNNGLTLLAELPPEQRPPLRQGAGEMPASSMKAEENVTTSPPGAEEASPDTLIAVTPQERICRRISGVNKSALARQLQENLKQAGATSLKQGSEQVQITNYWVILSPYPNRKEAAEAAAVLSQKRIKDFYVIRSGEQKNAISLGVFSTREHAQARQRQIVGLNTRLPRPEIRTKELPGQAYWIEYEVHDSSQQTAVETLLREFGVDTVEELPCE